MFQPQSFLSSLVVTVLILGNVTANGPSSSSSSACAVMRQYQNHDCTGRMNTYHLPVYGEYAPEVNDCGSGPFVDFTGSISHQFCHDEFTFHQSVYFQPGCKGISNSQTYLAESCLGGWRLVECREGPCETSQTSTSTMHQITDLIVFPVKHSRDTFNRAKNKELIHSRLGKVKHKFATVTSVSYIG